MGSLGEQGLGGWVGFGGGVGDHLDDLPEGKGQTVALVFVRWDVRKVPNRYLHILGKGEID